MEKIEVAGDLAKCNRGFCEWTAETVSVGSQPVQVYRNAPRVDIHVLQHGYDARAEISVVEGSITSDKRTY